MSIKGLKNFLLLPLFLIPLILQGQVKVTVLTDTTGLSSKGSVIYNLPRTRLLLDLRLVKTTREKGPFTEYARDFLGIENVITRNSTEYSISSLEIKPVPEPDPGQYYSVERKKRFPWINPQHALIMTTREGYLQSYNMPEKIQEKQKNIIRSRHFKVQQEENTRSERPFYHINDALLSAKEKNLKVDSSIRLPLRRPVYKVEVKDLTPVEKARIALDNLSSIQENIRNLAGGYQEVAYESATMDLMIKELKEAEQDLLSQFTGVSRQEIIHVTMSFLPENTANQSVIFAWFSKQNGLVFKSVEGALPVNIELKVILPPENKVQDKKGKAGGYGLVYRLPVLAECYVSIGDDLLYSGLHNINQYGKVVRLPRQVKKAVFYPETGGLKRSR